MKVAVISPNRQHLDDASAILRAKGHAPLLHEGGKSKMREIAEAQQPDLMIVDGICCDVAELAHVEYVTAHYPSMPVVLMCSTHSPEFLINSMRAGVREVLPSPAPAAALEAAVDRIAAKQPKPAGQAQGKVLSFMPCKGGAGATFLATNIGWQLAEHSSVLLVDLNLQFGTALTFLHDGRAPSNLAVLARDTGRLDASLLAASTVKVAPNYSMLAAPEEIAQAMEVRPEHIDTLLTLAVTQYDFVIVDVPQSLDTIAIRALDRSWRIFPVMQANVADLRNAGKLLEAFRSLGYGQDRVEFVVNRFDRNGALGLPQIQGALGGCRVVTVPNSWREVNSAINHGDALAMKSRGNAVARQLAELAASLNPRGDAERAGLLGRLFKRA